MKIGIIGSGFVGATAGYALIMQGIGSEIVLVDKNEKRRDAEADDLFHAVPFAHSLRVTAGDYCDLAGAAVVIIAAGVSQRPGETRIELLGRNAAVFGMIIPELMRYAPNAVFVVASNPVDIMTYVTAAISAKFGKPSTQIIGSGTTLDTARFRTLVAQHVGVNPSNVHGSVLGEHGDSEVLIWSGVQIAGMGMESFCARSSVSFTENDRKRIDDRVRGAAYRIIEGKGATYYGIGSALAKIAKAVLWDQRAMLTVSTPQENIAGVKNVAVSVLHEVGATGIIRSYIPPMSDDEEEALRQSAQKIKDLADSVIMP